MLPANLPAKIDVFDKNGSPGLAYSGSRRISTGNRCRPRNRPRPPPARKPACRMSRNKCMPCFCPMQRTCPFRCIAVPVSLRVVENAESATPTPVVHHQRLPVFVHHLRCVRLQNRQQSLIFNLGNQGSLVFGYRFCYPVKAVYQASFFYFRQFVVVITHAVLHPDNDFRCIVLPVNLQPAHVVTVAVVLVMVFRVRYLIDEY